MSELVELSEDVFYLPGKVNLGLVKVAERECVAIDSGLGHESAKNILSEAGHLGCDIVGLLNTHAHADHFGGNNYLVKQTGCKVRAPSVESSLMAHPVLEPFYLFGADAPVDMKTKFLMAEPSVVDDVLDAEEIVFNGKRFTTVPLPGHSLNQMGFVVDDVLFGADGLFGATAWDKYPLVYTVNVMLMMNSMKRLKDLQAQTYLFSHVEPMSNIGRLVDYNLQKTEELAGRIRKLIEKPAESATVLSEIFKDTGQSVGSLQQYYLSNSVVQAYLAYLKEQGLAACEFKNNRLFWRAIS